jgi:ATP-binding cassette subfamily C protein CydCD
VARVAERHRIETVRALRWAFLSGFALDLIATLSVALVALTAGLRLQDGALALAPALVVLLLAPEVFVPLRAVGAQYHASTDALEAAAVALELAALPALQVRGTLLAGEPVASLVDVTVRHPGRDEDALLGVSLALRAGQVVAVEGPERRGQEHAAARPAGSGGAGRRHGGHRGRGPGVAGSAGLAAAAPAALAPHGRRGGAAGGSGRLGRGGAGRAVAVPGAGGRHPARGGRPRGVSWAATPRRAGPGRPARPAVAPADRCRWCCWTSRRRISTQQGRVELQRCWTRCGGPPRWCW